MPDLFLAKKLPVHKTKIEPAHESIPPLALETVEQPVQETEHVSIFHLVHAVQEMVHGIGALTGKVDMLVNDVLKSRNFIDNPTLIGATIGYTVDYQGRKFLFAYSSSAITLVATDGTTKTVAAHQWTNISYPRGTVLTVQGGSDSTPALVMIRACDDLLDISLSATISQVAANINQVNGTALSPSNPLIDSDQIKQAILAGNGFFTTTGNIATGAANAFVALQLIANNISKSILLFSILIGNGTGLETDGRILLSNTATADAGLTTDLLGTGAVGNMSTGGGASSLTSVKCSPAATTETTGLVGTNFTDWVATANQNFEVLAPIKVIYIPKNTAGSIEIAQKKSTSGNAAIISAFWLELP